jgi:hypothetical protein
MPLAFTAASDLDALQNLRLQRSSKSLHPFEFVVTRGPLKLSKRTDAERLVELQDLVGSQAGNGCQFQHTGGHLLAHGLERGMRSGLVQSGDDAGYGIAHSGNLAHATLTNELIERNGQSAKAVGGARISSGAIRVTPTQGSSLPEFAKEFGYGRRVERGHGNTAIP